MKRITNLALVPPKHLKFFLKNKHIFKKYFKIKRLRVGQNFYTDHIYIFDRKGKMSRVFIELG